MAGKTKKKASEKKGADQVSIESYKNKIVTFLKANGKKTMPVAQLETKCRTKKNGRENFAAAFAELRDEGVVTVRKGMKAALCSELGLKTGEVTRLSRTFGFAMTDSGVEYFIPGKCMLGAMPHDRVLIADIASRSGEPEGEIVDILSFGSSTLTGRIERVDGELFLVPDIASRNHMIIAKDSAVSFAEGDKVLAEIVSRGRRHAEHKVRITSVFGSSELAQSCAKSILSIHGAPEEFPADALKEARRISEGGVQEYSFNNREDLRGLPIFTIVSGSLQDLDRAVIIGQRSFGKGLVQNILPMPYNSQMKVTVSKYYIPSGRCIQAIDYGHRDENGRALKVPDSLKTAFKTKAGRTVYDGFGIEPDIEVEPEYMSNLGMALAQKFMVFDYATLFCRSHKEIAPATDFEISDEVYADFCRFLKEKNLSYNTVTERYIKDLREVAKQEKYDEAIEQQLKEMEARLATEKESDLQKHREEVCEMLKAEILNRYYYDEGRLAGALKTDKVILRAIEELKK